MINPYEQACFNSSKPAALCNLTTCLLTISTILQAICTMHQHFFIYTNFNLYTQTSDLESQRPCTFSFYMGIIYIKARFIAMNLLK